MLKNSTDKSAVSPNAFWQPTSVTGYSSDNSFPTGSPGFSLKGPQQEHAKICSVYGQLETGPKYMHGLGCANLTQPFTENNVEAAVMFSK